MANESIIVGYSSDVYPAAGEALMVAGIPITKTFTGGGKVFFKIPSTYDKAKVSAYVRSYHVTGQPGQSPELFRMQSEYQHKVTRTTPPETVIDPETGLGYSVDPAMQTPYEQWSGYMDPDRDLGVTVKPKAEPTGPTMPTLLPKPQESLYTVPTGTVTGITAPQKYYNVIEQGPFQEPERSRGEIGVSPLDYSLGPAGMVLTQQEQLERRVSGQETISVESERERMRMVELGERQIEGPGEQARAFSHSLVGNPEDYYLPEHKVAAAATEFFITLPAETVRAGVSLHEMGTRTKEVGVFEFGKESVEYIMEDPYARGTQAALGIGLIAAPFVGKAIPKIRAARAGTKPTTSYNIVVEQPKPQAGAYKFDTGALYLREGQKVTGVAVTEVTYGESGITGKIVTQATGTVKGDSFEVLSKSRVALKEPSGLKKPTLLEDSSRSLIKQGKATETSLTDSLTLEQKSQTTLRDLGLKAEKVQPGTETAQDRLTIIKDQFTEFSFSETKQKQLIPQREIATSDFGRTDLIQEAKLGKLTYRGTKTVEGYAESDAFLKQLKKDLGFIDPKTQKPLTSQSIDFRKTLDTKIESVDFKSTLIAEIESGRLNIKYVDVVRDPFTGKPTKFEGQYRTDTKTPTIEIVRGSPDSVMKHELIHHLFSKQQKEFMKTRPVEIYEEKIKGKKVTQQEKEFIFDMATGKASAELELKTIELESKLFKKKPKTLKHDILKISKQDLGIKSVERAMLESARRTVDVSMQPPKAQPTLPPPKISAKPTTRIQPTTGLGRISGEMFEKPGPQKFDTSYLHKQGSQIEQLNPWKRGSVRKMDSSDDLRAELGISASLKRTLEEKQGQFPQQKPKEGQEIGIIQGMRQDQPQKTGLELDLRLGEPPFRPPNIRPPTPRPPFDPGLKTPRGPKVPIPPLIWLPKPPGKVPKKKKRTMMPVLKKQEYTPSLGGIVRGKIISKTPTGKLTGIEPRFRVKGKR
jgi:hypothetical protein